ncbi:hypothetical protein LTR37_014599 [Vermiconidia calcicola]|uniref:Uncharacterized protein n=1 Tax=Vermiconidia calcicola TaxID=1690605 RepID=A0ACC3MUQ9_9PEZI|nr:hypothetical protein LTR37_014599 [Vermiconidia calcicola]
MELLIRAETDLSNFQFFAYTPSIAAAIIFAVLFLLSTSLHGYQMFGTRTRFLIPFFIGGIFECIGYIGRGICWSERPDYSTGPYVVQTIMLLVAPALFAASVYMQLARIVLMVGGDKLLFIRRTWLTRLFVSGDILSFLMQSSGGGLMSTGSSDPSTVSMGQNIILAGLILQVIYFALFVIVGAIFHIKLRKQPTDKSNDLPWQRHMFSLYGVSLLIFIRCVIRVVEYAQGHDGYIITHELFLYIFDAVPMLLVMGIMNVVHPSQVSAALKGGKQVRGIIRLQSIV